VVDPQLDESKLNTPQGFYGSPIAFHGTRAVLADSAFKIDAQELLSIIVGWTKFYAWLRETYGNGEGRIKIKWFQYPKVAIKAIQYILLDVLKIWQQQTQLPQG